MEGFLTLWFGAMSIFILGYLIGANSKKTRSDKK